MTSDDILTQTDIAELVIWKNAQFNNNDLNHFSNSYEISSLSSSDFIGTSLPLSNNDNIIHQNSFISLTAANQYPIFNYPTTTNSIGVMPTTTSTHHQLQSIFSVPHPSKKYLFIFLLLSEKPIQPIKRI